MANRLARLRERRPDLYPEGKMALVSPGQLLQEGVGALFERKRTPTIEKRCVADVMKKQGYDMSRAFAICRSSMQKGGNYKKGTADLTSGGSKKSIAKSKLKDNKSKARYFEKEVKAARKD